jgi:replication factor C subunit 3/5
MENIPWVEKYRPDNFDEIVLDPVNKRIFKNIIKTKYFPNLLFYGPPGTGKTTTIVNLIKEYQGDTNKLSTIHLNASDERGIDIIRNQINQFVNSKGFYDSKMKFVVLDEVDYMTKNAQLALKYLLQSNCYNIRFCLICNYISKIDISLKDEFVCMRFNQLPKNEIIGFLEKILSKEKILFDSEILNSIQEHFNSDIRSMINYTQLNQNVYDLKNNILTIDTYKMLNELFINQVSTNEIIDKFNEISIKYNHDKLYIIKRYLNYIIKNTKIPNINEFLNDIELLIHNNKSSIEHILKFFINTMKKNCKIDLKK